MTTISPTFGPSTSPARMPVSRRMSSSLSRVGAVASYHVCQGSFGFSSLGSGSWMACCCGAARGAPRKSPDITTYLANIVRRGDEVTSEEASYLHGFVLRGW